MKYGIVVLSNSCWKILDSNTYIRRQKDNAYSALKPTHVLDTAHLENEYTLYVSKANLWRDIARVYKVYKSLLNSY